MAEKVKFESKGANRAAQDADLVAGKIQSVADAMAGSAGAGGSLGGSLETALGSISSLAVGLAAARTSGEEFDLSREFQTVLKVGAGQVAVTAGIQSFASLGAAAGGAAGRVGGRFAGAALGATIGSVVPGLGTAIGAVVGTVAGALLGPMVIETVEEKMDPIFERIGFVTDRMEAQEEEAQRLAELVDRRNRIRDLRSQTTRREPL